MLISIIIPVYNGEKMLQSCIESVLNQKEKNYEIILVNDGSIDNSLTICNQYSERYPDKIRVLHQENSGTLVARRNGFNISNGDYILYLDADDYILEDSLLFVNEAVKKFQCDLILFDYIFGRENTKDDKVINLFPEYKTKIFERNNKKEFYRKFLGGSLNNLCTKVFHRSLLDIEKDYSSWKSITNGEDRLQLLPIITAAQRILYVSKPIYYYRWTKGSQGFNVRIGNYSPENYYMLKTIWSEEQTYYNDWGLDKGDTLKVRLVQIGKVCDIVHNLYKINNYQTTNEIKDFIIKLSDDVFFRTISSDTFIKHLRIYQRTLVLFILRKRVTSLGLFFAFTDWLKWVKYRNK